MVKVADIRERSYSYTPLLTTFEDDSPGSDFFQQRRITHGYCAPNSLLQIGRDHWPNPRGRAPNLPGIAYLRHCKRELVPTAGQHRGDLPKLRSQSHMVTRGIKDHCPIHRLLCCQRLPECPPNRRRLYPPAELPCCRVPTQRTSPLHDQIRWA